MKRIICAVENILINDYVDDFEGKWLCYDAIFESNLLLILFFKFLKIFYLAVLTDTRVTGTE